VEPNFQPFQPLGKVEPNRGRLRFDKVYVKISVWYKPFLKLILAPPFPKVDKRLFWLNLSQRLKKGGFGSTFLKGG
jgi:hypothetical protein